MRVSPCPAYFPFIIASRPVLLMDYVEGTIGKKNEIVPNAEPVLAVYMRVVVCDTEQRKGARQASRRRHHMFEVLCFALGHKIT